MFNERRILDKVFQMPLVSISVRNVLRSSVAAVAFFAVTALTVEDFAHAQSDGAVGAAEASLPGEPITDLAGLLDYLEAGMGAPFLAPRDSETAAFGRYETVRQDGDRFVFEGIEASNPGAQAKIEELVIDGPRQLPDNGLYVDGMSISGASAELTNPDGSSVGGFGVGLFEFEDTRLFPSGAGTMTTRDPSDLGGMRIEDLRFSQPGGGFVLDRALYDIDLLGEQTPGALALEIEGLTLDATSSPLVGMVAPNLPNERIVIDAALRGSWDPATGTMGLDTFALDVEDIARVEMNASFDGVTMEEWTRMQEQPQQTPDGVTLRSADVTIERGPSFDVALDALAPVLGMEPVNVKQSATDAIGYYAGYLSGSDDTNRAEQIWEASKAFANGDIEAITLSASPNSEPSIRELEEAFDPTLGKRTDTSGFDLMGLSVETR